MNLEVWITDVEAAGSVSDAEINMLDATEMGMLKNIRLETERKRYLLSRLLLRKALSHLIGGNPQDWRFERDRNGKPKLSAVHGAPNVDFNMSHSGNAVVVAVSSAGEVGVDVERIGDVEMRNAAVDGIYDSVFTERELESLKFQPGFSHAEDTLKMWTVKEAYAKLLGVDAALNVFDFEVAPAPWRVMSSPTDLGPDETETIHLETHELMFGDERYHLALAARPVTGAARPALLRLV